MPIQKVGVDFYRPFVGSNRSFCVAIEKHQIAQVHFMGSAIFGGSGAGQQKDRRYSQTYCCRRFDSSASTSPLYFGFPQH